jgi:hypothetical protein
MATDLVLPLSSYDAPASMSIRPTRYDVTWPSLVARFASHERRLDKDGRGWSAAPLAEGTTRANVNVRSVCGVVGDIDHASEDAQRVLVA